eukprot:483650_1
MIFLRPLKNVYVKMSSYFVCCVCSQAKRTLYPIDSSEERRCKSCIASNKHKKKKSLDIMKIPKEKSSIFSMRTSDIQSNVKSRIDYIFSSNNIVAKALYFKPLINIDNDQSFYAVTSYRNKNVCALIVNGYMRENNIQINELIFLVIKYYSNTDTEAYSECCFINNRNDTLATPLLFEIINLNEYLKKENHNIIMICFKVNNVDVESSFTSNLNEWDRDRENHAMQLNVLQMSADTDDIFRTCYLNFIQNTNSLLSLKRLERESWYQHQMIKHNPDKQKMKVNNNYFTRLCGSAFLLKTHIYLGDEKLIQHKIDVNDTFCMIIDPQNNINYYIVRKNDNKLYPLCSYRKYTQWVIDQDDESGSAYIHFNYIQKIQKVWQRDNLFWKNTEFFPIISTISGIEFQVKMYGMTKTEFDQIMVPFQPFEHIIEQYGFGSRMLFDEWRDNYLWKRNHDT